MWSGQCPPRVAFLVGDSSGKAPGPAADLSGLGRDEVGRSALGRRQDE